MTITEYYVIDANGKRVNGPYSKYIYAKTRTDDLHRLMDGKIYGIEMTESTIKIEDYLQGEGNGLVWL